MIKERVIPEYKVKEIALLKKYISEYNVIGLVSMEKIDARSIQKLRKSLRGQVVMRMTKKRLMRRALVEAEKESKGKKGLSALCDEIKGISALVFTNMNPIKLSKFLQDNATKGPAKAGDISPIDILVKAGNTQIAPGPIISELNSVLKLPTMIKDGNIHIREETITHKPGDKIDLKQAILLGRLGIEPITISLDFYTAWENGDIIPEAVLKLDENKIISDVQSAAASAFALALAMNILTDDTVEPIMIKAIREANAIAVELKIITPDTIPLYVSQAAQTAAFISNEVYGSEAEDSAEEEEIVEKKKKANDKDDDAVMGEGIGALFG